jgi:DNA-binding NarL/FixJ family response regulator
VISLEDGLCLSGVQPEHFMGIRLLVTGVDEITSAGLKAKLSEEKDFDTHVEIDPPGPVARLADRFRPDVTVVDPGYVGERSTLHDLASRSGVLAYSGSRDEESIVRALEAGVQGYVLRTDPSVLLVMGIRAVAAEKAFLTPSLSDLLRRTLLRPEVDPPTNRERQILALLAEGQTNKHVANTLGLSVRTVEVHRMAPMRKLGAHSAPELMRVAIRRGLIEP